MFGKIIYITFFYFGNGICTHFCIDRLSIWTLFKISVEKENLRTCYFRMLIFELEPMCFRDLLVEAWMLMQQLSDCLLHVVWSFWLLSHTVKTLVSMQKELEQSMLS